MIGEKEAKKLDMIPVSNNTVSCHTDAMSEVILATLVSRVKKSEFYSLQVDKSTDVANPANLLVYVRYLFEGNFNLTDVFMRTNGVDCENLHRRGKINDGETHRAYSSY